MRYHKSTRNRCKEHEKTARMGVNRAMRNLSVSAVTALWIGTARPLVSNIDLIQNGIYYPIWNFQCQNKLFLVR